MTEFLDLANKFGSAGFATLLIAIIYGSWKEIWIWGRDASRIAERYETILSRERVEKEWWREIAMRATGIAEVQGKATAVLAKKSET